MKRLILILVILFLITVMGCMPQRAYVGDPLPSNQVAVIYAGLAKLRYTVSEYMEIESVDNRPIKGSHKYSVEVLPGDHVLKVTRFQRVCGYFTCDKNDTQFGTVSFNAEAGKVYRLKSKWKDGVLYFWIDERETGKIISNEKPPH